MSAADPLTVVADRFAVTWVTAHTAVLTEPHVDELLSANLWCLRGRERGLLVDTGNGIAVLPSVLARFPSSARPREIVAVATRTHADHIGGFHEFERRLLHPAEADAAARSGDEAPLLAATWVARLGGLLTDGDFELPSLLIDAAPHPGFDSAAFHITLAAPTHLVQGGDEIDLGARTLSIVDLSGHTPGSIGLIDHEENALLSGDAIYEGGLIDTLPESDVGQYVDTTERLRTLEVDVVYRGHGEPFGRERPHELAEEYSS